MESEGRKSSRFRKAMRKWLRFKGLNCCWSSPALSHKVANISTRIEEAAAAAAAVQAQSRVLPARGEKESSSRRNSNNNEDEESEPMIINMADEAAPAGRGTTNLAMLLAAERHLRKAASSGRKQLKKPLMRLFEEMENVKSKTRMG